MFLRKKLLLWKDLSPYIFVFLFTLGIWASFFYKTSPSYLTFSDSAKYADIARNILSGQGMGLRFTFWSPNIFSNTDPVLFPVRGISLAMPILIALLFKIFGVADFWVFGLSTVFYFFLVFFTFLLGKKIFGNLVGILGALAVSANLNFLEYSVSGASETLFAFEIVLGTYLFVLNRKWADILGFLSLILMYFSRPQAFIYIAGLILFWLLMRFPIRRAILYFFGVFVVGVLLDFSLFTALGEKLFLLPIIGRGINAIIGYIPGSPSSDSLRGSLQSAGIISILKKVFYNLYNFYRLLPQIASPYMWTFFLVGLLRWGKDRVENRLKTATIFMVVLTFFVVAITIPLFRYLHPVVPLVYLFAVATLVWIVSRIVRNRKKVTIISTALIFLFVVGQTLGVIFLDSRFEAKRINKNKPPVYVQLSRILKENTDPDDLVVTNLDTWGSWYGERRTVWYPIKPEQLNVGEDIPFDAIYLTNYLIDDENYYMGLEWRQVFESPQYLSDDFIARNYKLKGIYEVPPEETYEMQVGRAVLLVKRQ